MQIHLNLKSDVDKLNNDELKLVPSNLSNLKSKLNKLDIGKLQTTPVGIRKLSNCVKNDVAKKVEYNNSLKKVSNIKSDLVKKLTITQKFMKLKIKLILIMIMLNILMRNNLIN